MASEQRLSTALVLRAFSSAVAGCGGGVAEIFDDGKRLFARGVLSASAEIAAGDNLKGGVAIKALGTDVRVYPYLYRVICQNGTIFTKTIQSRQIDDLALYAAEDAQRIIREAVEACCSAEAFKETAGVMQTARERQMDRALMMMPFISRLMKLHRDVMMKVLHAFVDPEERTQYGYVNALTAVARDTPDPAVKWELEEMAGDLARLKAPLAARVRTAARYETIGVN